MHSAKNLECGGGLGAFHIKSIAERPFSVLLQFLFCDSKFPVGFGWRSLFLSLVFGFPPLVGHEGQEGAFPS